MGLKDDNRVERDDSGMAIKILLPKRDFCNMIKKNPTESYKILTDTKYGPDMVKGMVFKAREIAPGQENIQKLIATNTPVFKIRDGWNFGRALVAKRHVGRIINVIENVKKTKWAFEIKWDDGSVKEYNGSIYAPLLTSGDVSLINRRRLTDRIDACEASA